MIDLKCKNCSRHLGEAETIVADILCPGCGGSSQFKILNRDNVKMFNYKFAKSEREPKKKKPEVS